MIKVKIREKAERRGLTTAYQLQKLLGVSPDVASRLWKADLERIDLITLNRLCRSLKCQPGALLRYVADETP
jgi:DNA-binding Xre family transcriptional regulator